MRALGTPCTTTCGRGLRAPQRLRLPLRPLRSASVLAPPGPRESYEPEQADGHVHAAADREEEKPAVEQAPPQALLPEKLQPSNIKFRLEAAYSIWSVRRVTRHVGYAFTADCICAALTKLHRLYSRQPRSSQDARGSGRISISISSSSAYTLSNSSSGSSSGEDPTPPRRPPPSTLPPNPSPRELMTDTLDLLMLQLARIGGVHALDPHGIANTAFVLGHLLPCVPPHPPPPHDPTHTAMLLGHTPHPHAHPAYSYRSSARTRLALATQIANAAEPLLPTYNAQQLAMLLSGLARLGAQPSHTWLATFYAAAAAQLRTIPAVTPASDQLGQAAQPCNAHTQPAAQGMQQPLHRQQQQQQQHQQRQQQQHQHQQAATLSWDGGWWPGVAEGSHLSGREAWAGMDSTQTNTRATRQPTHQTSSSRPLHQPSHSSPQSSIHSSAARTHSTSSRQPAESGPPPAPRTPALVASFSSMLWALARMQCRPPVLWLRQALALCAPHLPYAAPHELSILTWALGSLGHVPLRAFTDTLLSTTEGLLRQHQHHHHHHQRQQQQKGTVERDKSSQGRVASLHSQRSSEREPAQPHPSSTSFPSQYNLHSTAAAHTKQQQPRSSVQHWSTSHRVQLLWGLAQLGANPSVTWLELFLSTLLPPQQEGHEQRQQMWGLPGVGTNEATMLVNALAKLHVTTAPGGDLLHHAHAPAHSHDSQPHSGWPPGVQPSIASMTPANPSLTTQPHSHRSQEHAHARTTHTPHNAPAGHSSPPAPPGPVSHSSHHNHQQPLLSPQPSPSASTSPTVGPTHTLLPFTPRPTTAPPSATPHPQPPTPPAWAHLLQRVPPPSPPSHQLKRPLARKRVWHVPGSDLSIQSLASPPSSFLHSTSPLPTNHPSAGAAHTQLKPSSLPHSSPAQHSAAAATGTLAAPAVHARTLWHAQSSPSAKRLLGQVLASCVFQVYPQLPSCSSRTLVTMLWSLSKLDARPPPAFLARAMDLCRQRWHMQDTGVWRSSSSSSSKNRSSGSAHKLPAAHEEVGSGQIEARLRGDMQMSACDTCMLAYALARLKVQPSPEWQHALTDAALLRTREATPMQLANLTWALMVMGVRPRVSWLRRLWQALDRVRPSLGSRECNQVAMAWLVLPRTHANRVLLAQHFPRLLEHVLEPARAEAATPTAAAAAAAATSAGPTAPHGPSLTSPRAHLLGASSSPVRAGTTTAAQPSTHGVSELQSTPSARHSATAGTPSTAAYPPGVPPSGRGSRLPPTSLRVLWRALREGSARRRAQHARREQAARVAASVQARSGVPRPPKQQLRVGRRMQQVRQRMLVLRGKPPIGRVRQAARVAASVRARRQQQD